MAEHIETAGPLSSAGTGKLSGRTVRQRGPWRDALRRFLQNKMGVAGGALVLFFVFLAIFGPALAPHDPLFQDYSRLYLGPSRDYWLGNDELGRDLLSRMLEGARTALIVATLVTLIGAGIGTIFGLLAAYLRGWVDSVLMRLADLLLAFPTFLLAAFLNATLRQPVANWLEGFANFSHIGFFKNKQVIDFIAVFAALAIVTWPGYARLIRSQVLSIREREFVEAARGLGASTGHILLKHVLPNSLAPIIVAVSVNFGAAILAESALSYLGIGVQPPTPSWGQMINANLDQWRYYPHLVLVPSGVLALLILGFNFFGDGVADAFNPRQSRR
jgi:peptide/nickel transport system permease protein